MRRPGFFRGPASLPLRPVTAAMPRSRPFPLRATIALLASAVAALPAFAQTDPGQDTRLRLEQQLDRQRANNDAETRSQAETLDSALSSITIDGERYVVGDTVDDVGRALYAALSRRQWADVKRFAASYDAFADRDPLLVHYARGALSRHAGKLDAAESEYRQLLALKPDFLPGRLELARTLFENHKDRAARQAFEAIVADLAIVPERGGAITRTVDLFLSALRKRRGWQGSLAIGPGYSSNLNQSSASYTCLYAATDGTCLVDRKVPDAIGAIGMNVEGTLSRRFPLAGQGGIRARTLFFGEIYPDQDAYSQATLITRIGYEHQSARDTVALSPSLEASTLGGAILYNAWGVNGEWTRRLSSKVMVKLEGNYRHYDYRLRGYQAQDGDQGDLLLTGWYMLPGGWTLLGGGDVVDKDARSGTNAYRQWGARLGIGKSLGKAASLLLLGAARWREYRTYDAVFEARRSDREQALTGIARVPALAFRGLVPEIIVQHNRTYSNIDWLYSWHRTTASVRLSHAF
jgi:outer membrane protein